MGESKNIWEVIGGSFDKQWHCNEMVEMYLSLFHALRILLICQEAMNSAPVKPVVNSMINSCSKWMWIETFSMLLKETPQNILSSEPFNFNVFPPILLQSPQPHLISSDKRNTEIEKFVRKILSFGEELCYLGTTINGAANRETLCTEKVLSFSFVQRSGNGPIGPHIHHYHVRISAVLAKFISIVYDLASCSTHWSHGFNVLATAKLVLIELFFRLLHIEYRSYSMETWFPSLPFLFNYIAISRENSKLQEQKRKPSMWLKWHGLMMMMIDQICVFFSFRGVEWKRTRTEKNR